MEFCSLRRQMHATTLKKLKIITPRKISQTNDYMLYESIYMNFLEKAQLSKWLPGTQVGMRTSQIGTRGYFRVTQHASW